MFARKPSPALTSLVKAVNSQVAASGGKATAFVVFLPADSAKLKPQLQALATKEGIAIPMTIAVDPSDVTRKFNVTPSDTMPVHVLVYKGKKVQKAFVLKSIKPADVKAVRQAAEQNAA